MSVEPVAKVLKLWNRKAITVEQVIGKMLMILIDHERRLLKLEAATRRQGNGAPPESKR